MKKRKFLLYFTYSLKVHKNGDKMMKKLMIASLLTAAAIFTACEETDDVTSCEVRVLGVRAVCMEASDDSYIRSECLDIADNSMNLGEGIVGTGCPGGAKKICDVEADGVSLTAYFYTPDDASASCDELLSDEEDEDDYGFTPDDDEYYMKAIKKAAKK